MRHTIASLLLTIITAGAALAQSGTAVLNSPDKRLAITFRTVANKQTAPAGKLVYAVSFKGKPLIEDSALGLDLKDQKPLGSDVAIVDSTPASVDTTYRLVAGKASQVRNHYNALRIELRENGQPARTLVLEARAYDDAVAFRYLVPEQPALADYRLTKENTEFRLSKDPVTYALVLPNYRSMYESEFLKLPASAFSNQGGVKSTVLLGLPLSMEVPGVAWMAITEANVRGNAAMYLVNPSGSWTGHWFESRLSPDLKGSDVTVSGTLPHQTAWRVLMVGDEPGRLVESNVLTSLNPESVIKDTSWIRPGKAAWDWWNGSLDANGKKAFTTENFKYYADFAARTGLEYVLVDAGWTARGDITKMNGRVDIPELVRYAATKGGEGMDLARL